MLKIRMSRGGAKRRPFYKIVIADSRRPRDGKFIEKVGYFNPLLPKDKKERLSFDVERIKYWLDKGAKPSFRIARFLGEAKIIPMPEKRNNPFNGSLICQFPVVNFIKKEANAFPKYLIFGILPIIPCVQNLSHFIKSKCSFLTFSIKKSTSSSSN